MYNYVLELGDRMQTEEKMKGCKERKGPNEHFKNALPFNNQTTLPMLSCIILMIVLLLY